MRNRLRGSRSHGFSPGVGEVAVAAQRDPGAKTDRPLFSRLESEGGDIEIGIVGTGVQARLQVEALASIRRLASVRVWGRDHVRAVALAASIWNDLGVASRPAMTVEELVSQIDVVVTATASRRALVLGEWLRPGQHLTALGADDDSKRELDSHCFARADRLFVDSRTQTTTIAEIGAALREGVIELGAISGELGELLDGGVAGRERRNQITIAKLSGIGVQDLAAAELVTRSIGVDAR